MLVTLVEPPRIPFHGDLRFELGALALVADTYYFELDHPVDTPDGMAAVRRSLVALLKQWKALTGALADGASVVLPFDYSDQYTGVFVVNRRGAELEVVPGSTTVEGYAHYPSDVADFHEQKPVVTKAEERKVTVELAVFLDAIDESVAAIEALEKAEGL